MPVVSRRGVSAHWVPPVFKSYMFRDERDYCLSGFRADYFVRDGFAWWDWGWGVITLRLF